MNRDIAGTNGNWDEEADVVVLGTGGAGLTGAFVAAREGASVIVLEKTELIGGTTSISGGGIWIPLNHHMSKVGVEDSREEALAYVRASAGDQGDDAIHETLVDRGAEMLRYLDDNGVLSTLRPWPSQGGTADYRTAVPGSKHGGRPLYPDKLPRADLGEWDKRMRVGPTSAWIIDKLDFKYMSYHAKPKDQVPAYHRAADDSIDNYDGYAAGTSVAGDLLRGCLRHGVRLLLETPGEELVVEDGRVIGVIARQNGDVLRVRARLGVLIATGGYSHNEELKRLWLTRPLEFACEIVENQGDGHLMGMAAGAQVAGLGDAWWFPYTPQEEGPLRSGDQAIGGTRDECALPHTLMVNRRGRRFFNEAVNYYDACESFGLKTGVSERNFPSWMVFDSQGPEKYSSIAARFPASGPLPGYLKSADTLEELATKVGIDPGGLRDTVGRFNGFARSGVDEDFHRGETLWDTVWGDEKHGPNPSLGTVEVAPFYAVEIRPGALATKGGLRVNTNGQVLSALRSRGPIQGLYAAGNASSGVYAGCYPGPGCTIGAAMTIAYVAARHLVQQASESLEPVGMTTA